jgi:hypothetical protein
MVTWLPTVQEPPHSLADPRELLDAYLDYYREALLRKLAGMAEADLRSSRLPSGWTPLELLVHLTWVERRWFQWDYRGEPLPQPWGDRGPTGGPDDPWRVPAGEPTEALITAFTAECARSRATVAGAPLTARGTPGGRFATPADTPTLAWILFHVLQEYARHLGHLDVARELADNLIGE